MADPASYRPAYIPTLPGVYRFSDPEGRVIYVGKARNLRQRLSNYFRDPAALAPRTRTMVHTASEVRWTVVGTEVEALTLEYTWIKQYAPRFNVIFRDDKSYPYLALSMAEEFPRAYVTREAHRKGVRYFGPYTHAWAIREVLDLLLRVFPVRSCSAGVFRRAQAQGRPCLLGYIDKCAAPCVGRISAPDHRALAEQLAQFLAGDVGRYIALTERAMQEAAAEQDFERAAQLRDDLAALRRVAERNAVVLPQRTSADVFALATDELHASVQQYRVRHGRIVSQRGWVTDRPEDLDDAALVTTLLTQVYGEAVAAGAADVPAEVLVSAAPSEDLTEWLTGLRGSRVAARVPQRGDKHQLVLTARTGAEQALKAEKLRRGADLNARSQALRELAADLGMAQAPLRIECYDISHTQGTYQVGSMVVFEDGLPKKRDYRTFNVRGADGEGARDDTEAIAEVLRRRFARRAGAAAAADVEEPSEPTSFAYAPGLLVIDGGAPQVAAAAAVLAELGQDIPVVGIAKRLEELWLPGEEFPLVLPRSSEALHLVQRVRDEAHRFAITHHRQRRSKAMTVSALDGLPGVGRARQRALLQAFGSVKRLRAASSEEIAAVPGIGPVLAGEIHQHLHRD